MKHGRWIAWHDAAEDEKNSEGEFRNGKKHGTWKHWGYSEYTLDGLPEPDITDPLQRALRGLEQARGVGKRIVVVKETWNDGQLTGPWTSWHSATQKKEAGEYQNALRHGLWIAWHKNGKMQSEFSFNEGKFTGQLNGGFPMVMSKSRPHSMLDNFTAGQPSGTKWNQKTLR
jgi:antitoxin component YwqK of YwqJK toxin-antitoxin module